MQVGLPERRMHAALLGGCRFKCIQSLLSNPKRLKKDSTSLGTVAVMRRMPMPL
jgi:hypothetical protein